jgi:hypothetical protein
MFTLCIPTMDRFDSFLSNYLPKYLNNILHQPKRKMRQKRSYDLYIL